MSDMYHEWERSEVRAQLCFGNPKETDNLGYVDVNWR